MASGFLKGTLILTIAGFVVKAIGSINWILLSRILGGEGIGIYQMAFPIYLLLLQVSSAGVPIAISILTAERLALNDYKMCIRDSTSIIKGHRRFHIIAMGYIRIIAAVFHNGHLSFCIGYNLYGFNRHLNVLTLRVFNDHLVHDVLI